MGERDALQSLNAQPGLIQRVINKLSQGALTALRDQVQQGGGELPRSANHRVEEHLQLLLKPRHIASAFVGFSPQAQKLAKRPGIETDRDAVSNECNRDRLEPKRLQLSESGRVADDVLRLKGHAAARKELFRQSAGRSATLEIDSHIHIGDGSKGTGPCQAWTLVRGTAFALTGSAPPIPSHQDFGIEGLAVPSTAPFEPFVTALQAFDNALRPFPYDFGPLGIGQNVGVGDEAFHSQLL